jgi:hypothetical protein
MSPLSCSFFSPKSCSFLLSCSFPWSPSSELLAPLEPEFSPKSCSFLLSCSFPQRPSCVPLEPRLQPWSCVPLEPRLQPMSSRTQPPTPCRNRCRCPAVKAERSGANDPRASRWSPGCSRGAASRWAAHEQPHAATDAMPKLLQPPKPHFSPLNHRQGWNVRECSQMFVTHDDPCRRSLAPPPPDCTHVGVVVLLLCPLLGHHVAVPAVACGARVGVVCPGVHDVAEEGAGLLGAGSGCFCFD